MIPNCKGCQEEYDYVCDMVKAGLHIATTSDDCFIEKGKHLFILLVDDNGKVICK